MKVINFKKHNTKKIVFLVLFAFIATVLTTSFGMQNYYAVDFSTGIVTATTLNVRSGPGINYSVVATVQKNEYIRVFAGIGEWYVVQVDDNYVGVVNKKYVKAIYSNSGSSNTGSTSGSDSNTTTTTESTLTADELEVFKLINEQRTKNRSNSIKNRFASTESGKNKSKGYG